MHRATIAVALYLSACSSGGRYVYEEEKPGGIPRAARGHCRSQAERLAKQNGGQGLQEDIARCLDSLLREDCASELTRTAEQLEKLGKGEASFFFRFPGAWDRDTMEDETEAMTEAACTSAKAHVAALAIFHGIRHSSGGRIPWVSFGESRPGFCREGCPTQ